MTYRPKLNRNKYLFHVTNFKFPEDSYFNPSLPVKFGNGNLSYPRQHISQSKDDNWYWGRELLMARRRGCIVEIDDVIGFESALFCKNYINTLYKYR